MCELYLYRGGARIGMVEEIDSLQWLPEFRAAGEFKLICAASAKNLALLRQWDTLYNPDTPALAAVITCLGKSIDSTGRAAIEARGEFSVRRWRQRVARGSYTVTDAAAGILTIAAANLRGLPVAVPDAAPKPAPCAEMVEWGSCLEAFVQLAKAAGPAALGFCNAFNPVTAAETLTLRFGVDRSVSGSADYMGYFGSRMQNLTDVSVKLDGSDYANVVLCGGEATETCPRITVEVGATGSTGTDRHELWVDGSGVSHQYQVQNADGTISQAEYTAAEYEAALRSYAAGALLNHLNHAEIKATASDTVLVYGRDYQLGDTLPVLVEELDVRAKAQVLGLKIIYESTGRTLRPVFGNFTML